MKITGSLYYNISINFGWNKGHISEQAGFLQLENSFNCVDNYRFIFLFLQESG